jgi:hypothetical protein
VSVVSWLWEAVLSGFLQHQIQTSLKPPFPLTFSLYNSTALWTLAVFFSVSLILFTVGMTPWTGDQPVARSLHTHRTPQRQNKCTQTWMPRVGFEPTTPVFEKSKTVHA